MRPASVGAGCHEAEAMGGVGVGKLAGWARRSRSSQRAASAAAVEQPEQQRRFGRLVVAGRFDDEDQRGRARP